MLALVFLSVCMDSCTFACVPHFLYGPCVCACVPQCWTFVLSAAALAFRVFIWTLVLEFLSVCIDSCACALSFSVFEWTLVLVLEFLSVFMDSCACA